MTDMHSHNTFHGIGRRECMESVFRALGDRNRLLILYRLLKGDSSVGDLADDLDIHVSNTSKHLKVLENAGLVKKRKAGLRRIYGIAENLRKESSCTTDIVLDLKWCRFTFSNSDKY
jgi:DNA-binding transcriptional ArsR family regulator